ncbi:MAG: hypothetical protein LC115_01980 [Bacteroidia bacterium]|nr:hypothetical protein [Bacteroidia bacterium]
MNLKNIIFFILLAVTTFIAAFGQLPPPTLRPTDSTAVIYLVFQYTNLKPFANEGVAIVGRASKREFKTKTNRIGITEVMVPIGDKYQILFGDSSRVEILEVAAIPNKIIKRTIIVDKTATIEFHFNNMNDRPVSGEAVWLISKQTGKRYDGITNAQGIALFQVPIGQDYVGNVMYNSNFYVFKMVDKGQATNYFTYYYHGQGKELIEARMKSEARAKEYLAIRDKKRKEIDSLRRVALERYKRERSHVDSLYDYYSVDDYLKALETEQEDDAVEKVFNRNKQWKIKTIVCDVTGSMGPFMDQLVSWFNAHYNADIPMNIVLFNDGDAKPQEQKIVGQTGGIYFCANCTPQSLKQTILKAMDAGYGGDSPENDVEALLAAQEKFPDSAELFLVADAYTDFRDISLIPKLLKPVRVILCGAYYSVEPVYLELAAKTKGSVHTIDKDYLDLIKLGANNQISIAKQLFQLVSGTYKEVKKK